MLTSSLSCTFEIDSPNPIAIEDSWRVKVYGGRLVVPPGRYSVSISPAETDEDPSDIHGWERREKAYRDEVGIRVVRFVAEDGSTVGAFRTTDLSPGHIWSHIRARVFRGTPAL